MTEKEKEYFEILMEEMNGKFSLVLEGHDAIRKEFNEQLTEVRQKQDMFESLLKFSHNELREEIQGVRTELKEEIQTVDRKLTLEIRDVGAKACLCVDARRQVEGHENRIRILERKAA